MKIPRISLSLFILLTTFLLVSACNRSGDSGFASIPDQAGAVVSVTKVSAHSKEAINAGLRQATPLVTAQYGVDAYRVVYMTENPQGELIKASGLLTVPRKASGASSPLLSYQHGTIFLDQHAPSVNHAVNDYEVIAASLGYIVASPDYIGYGASSESLHPHTHAQTLSGATIDLLRASKIWLAGQTISENGQLFLMGYSEGGYATYATQKRIQEELQNEFTVTASVPAASTYDLKTAAQDGFNAPIPTFLYYGFITKVYDEVYQLNLLEDMIRGEYFEVVNTYYDGTHSGAEIHAALPPSGSTVDSLYKTEFLNQFINDQIPVVTNLLIDNSLHDWVPNAPTRFFQNPQDELVNFDLVTDMTIALKNQGADVDLVACDAGGLATTHGNCFEPSLFYTVGFFAEYVKDL